MNDKITKIMLAITCMFLSCAIEPRDIQYGSDMCFYCKMMIVDQQHGAEAVSSKGKIFTFDAIECMVNFLSDKDASDFRYLMVNTYFSPGQLIDAQQGTFLISDAIASPMGAFLTAFADSSYATKMKNEKGGAIYDWDALIRHLQSKK